MFALSRNPAAEFTPLHAGAPISVTAGGAGDATVATSTSIDLRTLPDRFESVAFVIAASANLAATRNLTVVGKIETSADGATWSDITASATLLTLTSPGGSTETGAVAIDASLEYASNFVRLNLTPDLSAANTDTATITRSALFFGRRHLT